MHRNQMDPQVRKIQALISKADKFAREEIKSKGDELLVAAAMMAVVRGMYVSALGFEEASMVFDSIADSFKLLDYMEQTYPKPTIH